MTKKEFIAGIPFKMSDDIGVQPVYSYVNVGGLQCIQAYTVANPNPVYHCKVMQFSDTAIRVRSEILGQEFSAWVNFDAMYRVGDGLPVKSYTHDLMQANVYEIIGGYRVSIVDLYDGRILPHLGRDCVTLDSADEYAKGIINYK